MECLNENIVVLGHFIVCLCSVIYIENSFDDISYENVGYRLRQETCRSLHKGFICDLFFPKMRIDKNSYPVIIG